MCKTRRPELVMSLTCFSLMFIILVGTAIGSCAHLNSPTGFVQCMENPKDEAAAEAIVYAILDGDDTAALDAALATSPDVVKCLLQRAASAKGAGPVESARAAKAKAYLQKKGLSEGGLI